MFELNFRILFWIRLLNIKIPVILYYLGSLEPDVKRYLSFITRIGKDIYDFTIARFLFTKSDIIFSNSEPTISLIENKYNIHKKNIIYMPNGIERKHFIMRNQMNKRIIFNGRLTSNKGIFLLPKIITSIPKDWSLTIIGDGPETKTIEDLMEKKRNILWIKNIPHDEVFKYLSKSDILILPSYAEGSPRVCLEASVCGVPSVVFDVGDVKNTVLKPDNFVIPKFNEDIFIEKLNFLIKNYSSFQFDNDIKKIQNSYELDSIIDLFEKKLCQIKSVNN
jgi:glycosyltransferase involved in cell wall biosynthesis